MATSERGKNVGAVLKSWRKIKRSNLGGPFFLNGTDLFLLFASLDGGFFLPGVMQ
jgi:hypothetical protein